MSHRLVNLWGKIIPKSGLKSGANLFNILYNYLQKEPESTAFQNIDMCPAQLQFKGRDHLWLQGPSIPRESERQILFDICRIFFDIFIAL